ncbi:probable pectate lyase 4 [Brachypodium distachyon]|nr:probable pectate lyase 4 [Brachypodium distachyon]|eukprot:XP_003562741.4 probable pectate lyase 4 [Brachypodium distachyon]
MPTEHTILGHRLKMARLVLAFRRACGAHGTGEPPSTPQPARWPASLISKLGRAVHLCLSPRDLLCCCCWISRRLPLSSPLLLHHMEIPRPPETQMPYGDADCTLRALAARAEGFGCHAIGGLHGALYYVTSLQDDGCGTLREACRIKEPLWIVFEVSGTIDLQSYLRVSSYKTIDGRGHRVKLTGKGLQLRDCHHVIVCNLEFEGGRGHDVDGIQIKPNSSNIWIDRCTLADYDDGLIDITRQSTDITVSRCHFSRHDKTMLIGADPTHVGDRCIRVTIHHCFFDCTRQRHPRLRFGKVHLYNNYTRNWGIYAVCASVEAQIVSQSNIYQAGEKKTVFKYMPEKAGDKEEVAAGWIRSEGDAFLQGAQSCLIDGPGVDTVFRPEHYYDKWTMETASPALKEVIELCAGWQPVPRPPDC